MARTERPLLLDESLEPVRKARAAERFAGRRLIPLRPEVVRQWRDGLSAQVVPGTVAVVRFDKALLLEGMAREAGLRTKRSRIDAASFRIDFVERSLPAWS